MIADQLAERIKRDGPISVGEYMDAVTEAYYARGDVFGAAGDFTTSPEISQVFGELIGLWCAVVWQNMGAPATFHLVECGPGRGTLMKDLLRAAARVPGFISAVHIHLIERSRTLMSLQQSALKDHRVTWHDAVNTVTNGPTILVANEFLDALPIRQFEKTAHGWMERYVAVDANGQFNFALQPGIPSQAIDAKTGAIFETSPAVVDFIAAISARIAAQGGAALLIDYGHKASAAGDTLQAVKKHKPCGIFETPGEADLTAHVDFAAVANAARAAGTTVFGLVEQGTWLSQLGIKLRGLQLSKNKSVDVAKGIQSGIHRLTAPEAMGALFKVIAFTHPALATPDGFQQDAPS